MIAIERRSFPTPWSLAMFVLELSKPSGVCLAAVADGQLAGYLICSRYDRRLAPDEHRGRSAGAAARGSPAALLEQMIERAGHDASYTLEVRPSNAPRSRCTSASASAPPGTRRRYYQDTGEDAMIMWRTAEHGIDPGSASG